MNSQKLIDLLNSGTVLLCDGAMGTELQSRGLPAGGCPEAYNLTHPEIVQQIHRDYFNAGADLVETNSFGANRFRLRAHDLQQRVAEINQLAAQLATSVCPDGKLVAGSVGPSGEILQPYGERSPEELADAFSEQILALAKGGADVIFVETMMAMEEAELAVRVSKEKTHLPVVASMTFEKGKAGLRTAWGVDVPTAVQRLSEAGADLIGANCGKGFDEMLAIVEEMRPLTSKPVIAQSNAGLPEWVDGVSVYKETPESIKPYAEQLLKLGVNILGGCCGTGPAHIQMMRELVDGFLGK